MDFLAGLNPQQRDAAAHVEGPLLILAGAGSGKTRVITHRIAHLVHAHGVPAQTLLAVTFTNKAAEEMRKRVEALLAKAGASGSPNVSTFHSFCVRMLRRDGDRLAPIRPGFTRQFTIYDDDDQISIIKGIYQRDRPGREVHAVSRGAFSNQPREKRPADAAGLLQGHDRSEDGPAGRRLSSDTRKRCSGATPLDFDDLLLESVRLLRHDAELARTSTTHVFSSSRSTSIRTQTAASMN